MSLLIGICLASFNSTLVQLKDLYFFQYIAQSKSFNSTLVQLKAIRNSSCNSSRLRFNSTLVQLKEKYLPTSGDGLVGFNSTLVQLKVVQFLGATKEDEFQFYLSSIKRLNRQCRFSRHTFVSILP